MQAKPQCSGLLYGNDESLMAQQVQICELPMNVVLHELKETLNNFEPIDWDSFS